MYFRSLSGIFGEGVEKSSLPNTLLGAGMRSSELSGKTSTPARAGGGGVGGGYAGEGAGRGYAGGGGGYTGVGGIPAGASGAPSFSQNNASGSFMSPHLEHLIPPATGGGPPVLPVRYPQSPQKSSPGSMSPPQLGQFKGSHLRRIVVLSLIALRSDSVRTRVFAASIPSLRRVTVSSAVLLCFRTV